MIKTTMTKTITIKFALFAVFAALFLTTSAQAGILYTLNDNTTNNRIYGYSVNETTGALTPLSGFPVLTGVAGTGGRVASQMLTIDRVNNRLYAINDTNGTDSVSAYSLDPTTGALTALPFSPFTIPTASYYTIKVHPTGSPLIVSASNNTSASYVITPTTATAAAGSPFSTPAQPFTSGFSQDGNYFYVGGFNGTSFAGFSVNAITGVLTTLAGSPFASGVNLPEGYSTDAQGRIFVAAFSQSSVSAYTTTAGVPTVVTGAPFASGLNSAVDSALHPNGNFLVAVARGSNNVGSYQISGTGAATTLAAVAGSPFASGGTLTQCLAFNAVGTFLYTASGTTRNLTTYSFNPATGVMSNINLQPVSTNGTTGTLNGLDYHTPSILTAASVSVAGKVSIGKGAGLANAVVTLTDSNGETRAARTTSFGYYRFDGVEVGQSYTIQVTARRYNFTPQIVTVNEEIEELNFTAQ